MENFMQIQDQRSVKNTSEEAQRAVRGSIDRLHELDEQRAKYLEALAFVLMRVADADQDVLHAETRCMESILTEYAFIPSDQAMLVTEIARHRCRMADAGAAYSVSRELRPALDETTRQRLLTFLERVALADGELCDSEYAAIKQIGWELGIVRSSADTNA